MGGNTYDLTSNKCILNGMKFSIFHNFSTISYVFLETALIWAFPVRVLLKIKPKLFYDIKCLVVQTRNLIINKNYFVNVLNTYFVHKKLFFNISV